MLIRVQEILEQDSFETQHGTLLGWKFRATDENGNDVFLGINTKPNNTLAVGQEFDFEPSGKFAGTYTLGKRAQNQGNRPNPYGGNRGGGNGPSGAPAPAQRPANAPQTPSRPVPTTDERAREFLQLLPRAIDGITTVCNAKALDASPGDILTAAVSLSMHLMIGLDRGDFRRPPSAAEQEAAKAAEALAAAEAVRRAEEAAEAARQAALRIPQASAVPGYNPVEAAETGIPF